MSALATLIYLVLLVHPSRILEIPRLKIHDLFLGARYLVSERPAALKDLFLIAVDQESLDRIKEKWPFRWRLYAEVLDKIRAGSPRLVALDLVFWRKVDPLDEFLLSEAVRKAGNVILGAYVDDAEGKYILSREEIRREALSSGVVNLPHDKDFRIRRARLFYRDTKGRLAAWPWEMEILTHLLGLNRGRFKITRHGIRLGKGFRIPFYRNVSALINYRFKENDLERMPLWKVLEGENLESKVRNRVVVIGATASALQDTHPTALGMMPGVVIHTNWLVNLMRRDFIHRIPVRWDALCLALIVFISFWSAVRWDVLRGLTVLLLTTTGFWALALLLFWRNYSGDYLSPVVAGWAVFLVTAFYRYFHSLLENVKLRGEVVTDPLTGLYNRRFLEAEIDAELARLASGQKGRKTDPFRELSLLMIDIDDFKKVNDTYGHQFGDDVLKSVSFSIRENTRKEDVVARFGGEEFCVVLVHTSKEEAIRIAEKVRRSVEVKKFSYVNQVARFTISIGVASAKADHLLSSRAIVRAADMALYEAKRKGKNRVCTYEERAQK